MILPSSLKETDTKDTKDTENIKNIKTIKTIINKEINDAITEEIKIKINDIKIEKIIEETETEIETRDIINIINKEISKVHKISYEVCRCFKTFRLLNNLKNKEVKFLIKNTIIKELYNLVNNKESRHIARQYLSFIEDSLRPSLQHISHSPKIPKLLEPKELNPQALAQTVQEIIKKKEIREKKPIINEEEPIIKDYSSTTIKNLIGTMISNSSIPTENIIDFIYQKFLKEISGILDVLVMDEESEVTEFRNLYKEIKNEVSWRVDSFLSLTGINPNKIREVKNAIRSVIIDEVYTLSVKSSYITKEIIDDIIKTYVVFIENSLRTHLQNLYNTSSIPRSHVIPIGLNHEGLNPQALYQKLQKIITNKEKSIINNYSTDKIKKLIKQKITKCKQKLGTDNINDNRLYQKFLEEIPEILKTLVKCEKDKAIKLTKLREKIKNEVRYYVNLNRENNNEEQLIEEITNEVFYLLINSDYNRENEINRIIREKIYNKMKLLCKRNRY